MKIFLQPAACAVRSRLAMLAISVCTLITLPAHSREMQCELIENSQISHRIVERMLEAADEGHLYRVDPVRSSVVFQVRHFPFGKKKGAFSRFDGGLTLPQGGNTSRQALFLIKADSMVTGDEDLDDYLKSATFFDAKQFPDIIFVSTGFDWLDENTARLYGKLTLRGITRPFAFDVQVNSTAGRDADNLQVIMIKADANLQRSDFGMHALSWLVSDTVTLKIRIEATRIRT